MRLALEDFGAKCMCLLVPCIEGKRAAEESFFADPELLECFLNLPEDETSRDPIDLEWIQTHQANDPNLIACSLQQPQEFPIEEINRNLVICKKSHVDHQPQDWKKCIPDSPLTECDSMASFDVGTRRENSIV